MNQRGFAKSGHHTFSAILSHPVFDQLHSWETITDGGGHLWSTPVFAFTYVVSAPRFTDGRRH